MDLESEIKLNIFLVIKSREREWHRPANNYTARPNPSICLEQQ